MAMMWFFVVVSTKFKRTWKRWSFYNTFNHFQYFLTKNLKGSWNSRIRSKKIFHLLTFMKKKIKIIKFVNKSTFFQLSQINIEHEWDLIHPFTLWYVQWCPDFMVHTIDSNVNISLPSTIVRKFYQFTMNEIDINGIV